MNKLFWAGASIVLLSVFVAGLFMGAYFGLYGMVSALVPAIEGSDITINLDLNETLLIDRMAYFLNESGSFNEP